MKIRTIVIFILIAAVAAGSCGSRRTRLDRKNLIPEKDLITIMKDLYITDGLVGMPRIVMKYSPFDSVSTYNHIIEKHGYTKEAMDRTMKYYFIRDPKRLIKIYDKVLSILSEMESRVQKEIIRNRPKNSTLWPGPDSYSFPDNLTSDSTSFRIIGDKAGYYILTASVTAYPDDNSDQPGFSVMAVHADSLATGKRKYLTSFIFLKDGKPHKYRVSVNVPPKSRVRIEGTLYAPRNNPDTWEQHLLIQNVSLTHSPIDQ